MGMIAIAAVDENWGIGYRNDLLVRIPEDQKFFRVTTAGSVVVMGRMTLESFPGKKPLSGRTNIVLSRNPLYNPPGVIVVHDREELFAELRNYEKENVFLIGGEHVYRAFLDDCTEALITKIEATYQADAYFPNLDVDPGWELTNRSEPYEFEGKTFSFCSYKKRME